MDAIQEFREELSVMVYEDMPGYRAELVETLELLEEILDISDIPAEVIFEIMGVKQMIRMIAAQMDIHRNVAVMQRLLRRSARKWD